MYFPQDRTMHVQLCVSGTLDWGQVTCVTLRSLHCLPFIPRLRPAALAVRTLLSRLLSPRIVPEQLEYIHIWLELNVLVLNVLNTPWLLFHYTTSKQGSTSGNTDASPFLAGDCVDGSQWARTAGRAPSHAHSSAGREQLPGRAPRAFLGSVSHRTLPASPTAKLSQEGNVTS